MMARPRDFEEVLAKLPDARKSGDHWTAPCPAPGHTTPNGHLTLKDAGDKALVTCQGGRHTYQDICAALGFTTLSYTKGKAPSDRRVTRFTIRDLDGKSVAVHVRRDGVKGKETWWELPNRTPGLGGMHVVDLPLYGSEHLSGLPDGAVVVVVEGEKAAQALRDNGHAAVGTVTAAGSTPGMEALRPLVCVQPILWPDNDDVGRKHMSHIAARLHELGCQDVRIVEWAEAPEKGDAADAIAGGIDVVALLRQAVPIAKAEAISLTLLLEDVEAFIHRYVATGDSQLTALTLWVAHTWTLEAAECTPYLHITSPEKQSGKTRLLEALALVVGKPWFTCRASAAVLVRKVARDAPSLLLDETDSAFKSDKEYSEALRGILNAGYRRGGVASLCVKAGGDFDLADFPVFCPKALAGIGELPDTIADRSIRVTMKRRAPSESVERFRLRTAKAEAAPLRERLETWANTAVAKLTELEPALPESLGDRACDVWEPLLAIAELAGGMWPARAREAAIVLSGAAIEDVVSLGVRLLHDIREVLRGRTGPIPTCELLEGLTTMEEAPWGDLRGKPLAARGLARILRPYGVKSRTVRVGTATMKGYHPGGFQDAWERYCSYTLEISVTSVTSVTNSGAKANAGEKDVTDVTDVTANTGIHAHDRMEV